MNFTTIKYEKKDKTALLTLNRPEKLNAWTPLMAEELAKAIEDANTDKSIGTWIAEGPHIMILLPESLMSNLPTDPYSGGPYVMWKGTEFVHMMVPLETTKPLN